MCVCVGCEKQPVILRLILVGRWSRCCRWSVPCTLGSSGSRCPKAIIHSPMVFVRCRGGCRSCQWHRSLRPDPRLARLADDAVLCCAEDTLQGVLQFLSGTDQARAACASRALNQCYEGCRANRGFSCDSLPLTDCGSDESGADTGHSTADDEYEEPRAHRRMRFQQRREERGQRVERWEWDKGLYHAGAAAVLPGHELPARTEKEQQV